VQHRNLHVRGTSSCRSDEFHFDAMDSRDSAVNLQIDGWLGTPVGISFLDVHFQSLHGGRVPEIQRNGTKSASAGTLRRAALAPAMAVAVLAFAAPAHAGDPLQPPAAPPTAAPLAPVDDSVSTLPETGATVPETTETEMPEMGVEPGASALPAEEPAPVAIPADAEAPVEPAAPKTVVKEAKAPANQRTWVQVRIVQPRPVVRRWEPQRAAISPPRPVIRLRAPGARRHLHHPARHATRTSRVAWYQVSAAQYQRTSKPAIGSASKSAPTRAQKSRADARQARARASNHIRGTLPNRTRICAQQAAKCLDSCADNGGWKVVRNDRWISGCKSPNAARDMLLEDRNSAGDTGLDRPGPVSNGKPGAQYQCPGTQYHDYWCDESLGESPTLPLDEEEPDVDEPDVDTDTPEEEPTASCPETAVPVDASSDEADSDLDDGGWDKPSLGYCDHAAADAPIRPGRGPEPPTSEQGPPAQVPQPPVPPAPQPAQVPLAPPPSGEAAAPTQTEPSAAPPPDAQPTASEPPPAAPAPTPSVPPADAVPKNMRATRVGVTPAARNPTPVSDEAPVVSQPSTHVVARATPKKTAPAPKKRVATKHAVTTPELPKARRASPVTRPATDVTPSQQPRVFRPVAAASNGLDGWLLAAMTLFGLSVLAFALAAVSEVDGGTAALTKMRSRLGSRGLSARRVRLDSGNGAAAPSRPPDGIRYRD
jgi:hypothetical protein